MKRLSVVVMCCWMVGCQHAPVKDTSTESQSDVIKAVGTMTEGLTNQAISPEDLKRLGAQMQNDPEARSAVEAVNQAMQAQQTGIRYCPVDGKRFSNKVSVCPSCGAQLKDLDE